MRASPQRSRRLGAAAATVLALALGACGEEDDPRALLQQAAEQRIESGQVRLKLKATLDGLAILGSSTVIEAWGPARWTGERALPELDWKLLVLGGGNSIPARVWSTGENLFVDFQGRDYEAGRKLLPWLYDDARRAPGAQRGGFSLRRLLGTSPAGWLDDPVLREGEEIGGDPTRVIAGRLNVDKALAADVGRDSKGLGGRLRPLRELEASDRERLADAIQRADVRVNVDEEGYPRRVFARVRFETPPGVDLIGIEGGRVDIELVLERRGARVDVRPPRSPDSLTTLLRAVGVVFGIEQLEDVGR